MVIIECLVIAAFVIGIIACLSDREDDEYY